MKKVIAAVLACMFVFSLTFTAFAAVSPTAPTVQTTRPVTPPVDIDPTIKPTTKPSTPGTPGTPSTPGSDSGSGSKPTTTRKSDVDDTTRPGSASTTKRPVTSDKAPVSPDTGSYVSKTVSAAALVAIALSGAVIYTTKKKAE